jgi:hypothetical protein
MMFFAEKDYAILTVLRDISDDDRRSYTGRSYTDVFIKKIVNDIPMDVIFCGGIVGAFNGLHADGFTTPGHPIDVHTDYDRYLLSRRRHSAVRTGEATSIIFPIDDEMVKRRANAAKQFAVYISNAENVNRQNSLTVPMKQLLKSTSLPILTLRRPYEAIETQVYHPRDVVPGERSAAGFVRKSSL